MCRLVLSIGITIFPYRRKTFFIFLYIRCSKIWCFAHLFLPLQPIMSKRTRRRISAWLLLSVFLPMLLLSSLHVHEEAPIGSGCSECVNHIPHHGHLSLNTIHLNDCVLCQFATLPFLMSVMVFVTVVSWGCHIAIVQPLDRLLLVACRHHSSRAPPVISE